MANVKISDLALATLPLDTANTFLELQTIEGGIEVSRKLSAQDLGIGGGVTSVNSGTNITVDNTDPANPIVNLDDVITLGRAILTDTNDPDLVDTVVALNVGAADPTTSPHIEIGPTSIEAKSSAAVGNILQLSPNTGVVQVGSGLAATPAGLIIDAGTGTFATMTFAEAGAGAVVFAYDASLNVTQIVAQVVGEPIRIEDNSDLAAVFTPNAAQELYNAGVSVMRTVAAASGGLEANNLSTGAGFERVLTTADLGVASVTGGTNINISGTAADPVVNLDAAITGVSVNGVTLTTAGVATNYLDETGNYSVPAGGGGGSPFATPLDITGDINTATPPTTEAITALLRYTDLAGNDLISTLGHSASNVLQLSNLMQGGNFQLNLIDSLGNTRSPIFVDPADQVRLDYPGFQPKKKVLGDLRRFETASTGIDVYGSADQDGDPTLGESQDTLITLRNNSATLIGSIGYNVAGALEITNDVYQSRIDLYTTDDAGGSIAQIEMAFGASQGITFYTHSGGRQYRMVDTGNKKDLTARFNITGSDQGSTAGQDAAIGFVDNILTPVDRGVLGFEGSDQLNLRCDVGELHLQIDDGGPTDGVTIAPGGAVTLFENGTAQAATTALGLDVRDTLKVGALGSTTGVIKLGEQANADADEAGFGQLWVRNDVPNNLFFTDDSGNDFLVAGTGAGGDISAGSNLLTGTSFVAVANVSPEINREYFVLAAVEITAPAADDGQVQFTIDTNARFYGTLTNTEDDTTQIIEGQLAEVVTNSVVVPTSGAATPGGTYCTIVGRLVMGATTGTMSLRCAKNADTGADGNAIRGAIKLIPIDP